VPIHAVSQLTRLCQGVLLFIAVLCIPLMLLPKPLLGRRSLHTRARLRNLSVRRKSAPETAAKVYGTSYCPTSSM
jgi:hypothetical protein